MRWFTRAWHQGELTDAEWDAVNADYERHVQQLPLAAQRDPRSRRGWRAALAA